MKYKITTLTLLICFLFNQDQFKLSQKDFVSNADGKEFVRGRYLIVLGDASLESSLSDVGGDLSAKFLTMFGFL